MTIYEQLTELQKERPGATRLIFQSHLFQLKLVRNQAKEVQDGNRKVIQHNAYLAHPENLLVALLKAAESQFYIR